MAYERPSIEEFEAMFPAFKSLNITAFDAWFERAEQRVTEAYGDEQQAATELLAAHLMETNGVGLGSAGQIAAMGATSFKSGGFSATVSDAVVIRRMKGGYSATSYGQQFAEIQDRIFGGPRLVGCA